MKFHINTSEELFAWTDNQKKLITGNEAYARGLYEAGCQFLSTYPGTPTSEIGDNWQIFADKNPNVFYDLSINETVAFEAAVGASWTGIRSAVSFKHLGMNLISDALHSVMYSGIDGDRKAGLVILCGGDPNISSSTNAQDVRLFSYHSKLPIIEPSTVQECNDFVRYAFELSEYLELPVMVYSPNSLNHGYGVVHFNTPFQKIKGVDQRWFRKDFDKYLNAIHWARKNQHKLYTKINKFQKSTDISDLPCKIFENRGQIGIKLAAGPPSLKQKYKIAFITGGITSSMVEEICTELGVDVPRFRFIVTFPIVYNQIINFLKKYSPDVIFVIEEGEAFLEGHLKSVLYDLGVSTPIFGKNLFFPTGSLTTERIRTILGSDYLEEKFAPETRSPSLFLPIHAFKKNLVIRNKEIEEFERNLAIREPTFCPGCSHRNVFYALKRAATEYQQTSGIEPIYGGDIGCYTMGMSQPYGTMDWLICMGAGVGIANGVGRTLNPTKQHLVAMIGDSTLFHTGLQPIINLAKYNSNVLVLILDNYYTAMTGHQTSPSTPSSLSEHPEERSFSIKKILASLGYTQPTLMDGYSIKQMQSKFRNLFSKPGLKFVLVKAECALNKKRRKKALVNGTVTQFKHSQIRITESCVKCGECFEEFGCTAIQSSDGIYYIDTSKCVAESCRSCLEVCENDAIRETVVNSHKPSIWTQNQKEDIQQ